LGCGPGGQKAIVSFDRIYRINWIFIAFPEERQQTQTSCIGEAQVSVESGLRFLRVFWSLKKTHVNPVNPFNQEFFSV
jgi:hypothetical protein